MVVMVEVMGLLLSEESVLMDPSSMPSGNGDWIVRMRDFPFLMCSFWKEANDDQFIF